MTELYSILHGYFCSSMLTSLSYGQLVSPDDIAYVSKNNHVFKCLYDLMYFPRHILKTFKMGLLETSEHFFKCRMNLLFSV